MSSGIKKIIFDAEKALASDDLKTFMENLSCISNNFLKSRKTQTLVNVVINQVIIEPKQEKAENMIDILKMLRKILELSNNSEIFIHQLNENFTLKLLKLKNFVVKSVDDKSERVFGLAALVGLLFNNGFMHSLYVMRIFVEWMEKNKIARQIMIRAGKNYLIFLKNGNQNLSPNQMISKIDKKSKIDKILSTYDEVFEKIKKSKLTNDHYESYKVFYDLKKKHAIFFDLLQHRLHTEVKIYSIFSNAMDDEMWEEFKRFAMFIGYSVQCNLRFAENFHAIFNNSFAKNLAVRERYFKLMALLYFGFPETLFLKIDYLDENFEKNVAVEFFKLNTFELGFEDAVMTLHN